MPRIAERYSSTPFARVLTAFMWSKTPPWSTSKVAAVLGIARARVSNWVYKDIVPDIETMLVVLARLNIPTSALLQAYAEDGLYVPPLTLEEAQQRQQAAQASSRAGTQAAPLPPPIADADTEPSLPAVLAPISYAVPHGRYGRRPAIDPAITPPMPTPPMPTPPPLRPPAERPFERRDHQEQESANRDWQIMLAHARRVLKMTGMSEAAVNGMLADLTEDYERGRSGQPSERDRRIAEEFAVEQPQREPDGDQRRAQSSTTKSR